MKEFTEGEINLIKESLKNDEKFFRISEINKDIKKDDYLKTEKEVKE